MGEPIVGIDLGTTTSCVAYAEVADVICPLSFLTDLLFAEWY